MWRQVIEAAIDYYQSEKARHKESAQKTTNDANELPHFMEAQYDTSRAEHSMQASAIAGIAHQAEQAINILGELLRKGGCVDRPMAGLGSLVKIDDGEEVFLVLFVPFYGGATVESSYGDITLISIDAPMAKAIRGHGVKEQVSFQAAAGERQVSILEVHGGDER